MKLVLIAVILVAMAGASFAMQNNVPVTVNFLFWRFDSSLSTVILLAVAFSVTVVILVTTPAALRRQWSLSRQKRRIEELETNGEKLRARIAELEAGASPPRPLPLP